MCGRGPGRTSRSAGLSAAPGTGGRRDRGTFELRTPVRQGVRLPWADPAACTVTAQGLLRRHGSLHLWVTARV